MTQLLSVIEEPKMEKTDKKIEYLENSWVLAARKRLKTLKAAVWIENIWISEKQMDDYIGIMDEMVMIPGVNVDQIKAVNMCRVYLQVIMLSDMANVQGTVIPPGRITKKWRRDSSF